MRFHPPNKKFTRLYQRILYRWAGKMILLLTTRGRKTGKLHTVGLQYELIHGSYYIGAADGECADWYRNLVVEPLVEIQVGPRHLKARAKVVKDPEQITDFLEYRLKKRPLMIRMVMRMDGLRGRISRGDLQKYAGKIRMVILTPESIEPG